MRAGTATRLPVIARHGRSLDELDDTPDELAQDQPALASCYGAAVGDRQLLGTNPGRRTQKLSDPVHHFGGSVALSKDGDTLAVSATWEENRVDGDQADNSAPAAGAAYTFVRGPSGQWTQQVFVKASNTDPGDLFGSSLALSGDGDTLIVETIASRSWRCRPMAIAWLSGPWRVLGLERHQR